MITKRRHATPAIIEALASTHSIPAASRKLGFRDRSTLRKLLVSDGIAVLSRAPVLIVTVKRSGS